jgi:hypothetical protein
MLVFPNLGCQKVAPSRWAVNAAIGTDTWVFEQPSGSGSKNKPSDLREVCYPTGLYRGHGAGMTS